MRGLTWGTSQGRWHFHEQMEERGHINFTPASSHLVLSPPHSVLWQYWPALAYADAS